MILWDANTAAPPVSPGNFAFLIGGCLILVFSFFLLHETIVTVRFMLPDRPKPDSGRMLCVATSITVVVLWLLWALAQQGPLYSGQDVLGRILVAPREFAPGLLLASFLPTAVAAWKLILIVTAGPSTTDRAHAPAWLSATSQGVLVLLNAAASVVTLYKAIRG